MCQSRSQGLSSRSSSTLVIYVQDFYQKRYKIKPLKRQANIRDDKTVNFE